MEVNNKTYDNVAYMHEQYLSYFTDDPKWPRWTHVANNFYHITGVLLRMPLSTGGPFRASVQEANLRTSN